MSRIRKLRRALSLVMLLLVSAAGALAQTEGNADPVFCKGQISDPDVAFQVDLCTAHAGCALVIKVHKTCTAVRGFAERLGTSIGQGVKTLFGTRKEVQPENIWEAVQTENTRRLDDVPEAKARSSAIREALAKKDLRATDMSSQSAGGAVLYGEVKDGKLQGWGMKIGANGVIERGEYRDNKLDGRGEKFLQGANGAGIRAAGEFRADEMQGEGVVVNATGTLFQGRFQSNGLAEGQLTLRDGSRQEGRFDSTSGQLVQGSKYAAGGNLVEKGTYRDGQLYVGERYASGTLVASVNRPREQMQQAEAQQAGNAERMRREAAERAASEERARQEAAAREQKFRDDLGRMNAGQLYALADEFRERGDNDKARQALRALVTRFPDHPLAATAATQMSAATIAAAAPSSPPRVSTSPASTAAPRVSSGSRQGSCVRNFNAHDTQLISRGLGIGYSESRAYQESRRLVMAMLAPCVGEDAEARRMHEEARQALEKSEQACNASGRRAPCPELGRPQDADYLRDTRESLRLMRSDPNWADAVESRYAQENQANAGCNAELDRLSRIQRDVERRFANNLVAVERLERVMWTLGEAINVLDTKCPQTPVNRMRRDTFHGTLQSIVGTCSAVSSRTCRPAPP